METFEGGSRDFLREGFGNTGHNDSRAASGFAIEWNTYKPASHC